MVTTSFLPSQGGIETYLAGLCDQLKPHVAVMAQSKRDGKPLPTDVGYTTIGFKHLPIPAGPMAREIAAEARRLGTKKIIFGTVMPLGFLGPRLKRAGFSYITIMHGAEILTPSAIGLLRLHLNASLAGADRLLSVSRYSIGRMQEMLTQAGLKPPPAAFLPVKMDTRIYNPDIDTKALRAKLGLQQDDKVALFLSRLVPRKGADKLITAVPELLKAVPNVRVVIGGTGPQETKLRRLAAAFGDRVIFTGRVSEAEKPALYAMADVFVFPAANRWGGLDVEGLGIVLLEAQACGTPVVTGRCGGTVEAMVDGQTGLAVDANDQAQLVNAVTKLLNDPKLAKQMGKAGREFVQQHFTSDLPPKELLDWLG